MTHTPQDIPEAIEPTYTTSRPNEPIKLFEGHIVLEQNEEIASDDAGLLEAVWLLRPNIRFTLSSETDLDLEAVTLKIPELGLSCEANITQKRPGFAVKQTRFEYRGYLSEFPVFAPAPSSTSNRVIFHVPNFSDFTSGSIRMGTDYLSRGRLCFEDDTWRVTLNRNPNTGDLLKQLQQEGGFGLTHTGALERKDGSLFTAEEAEHVCDALHSFLSFVRGFWCSPLLLVGKNNEHHSWKQWGMSAKLTPWKNVRSWFPYDEPVDDTLLSPVFRSFMGKWNQNLWQRKLRIAIHWYIEANLSAGGAEGGIILIQAALELLAWMYLVQDRTTQILSVRKFKKNGTAANIRLLLNNLQMPLCIPSNLNHLSSAANNLEATDGPDAFVKIRNDIVHPEPRRTLFSALRIQAYWLGLWYLELTLLYLLGYNGMYYNRLLSGYTCDVKNDVPWK